MQFFVYLFYCEKNLLCALHKSITLSTELHYMTSLYGCLSLSWLAQDWTRQSACKTWGERYTSCACGGKISRSWWSILQSVSFFYHKFRAGEKALHIFSRIFMSEAPGNYKKNVACLLVFCSFSSVRLFPVTFQPVNNIYAWKRRG